MNSSAEKASRKWANGAFGRIGAAMVTATSALLLLGMPCEPAFGARASRSPWDNLFRVSSPPKARATVRHAAVPLPKPRPAEAPSAEPAAEEQQAAAPKTGKPTEQAAPAAQPTPQPSAC